MVRPPGLKRRGEVLPWCLWRECSREGGRNAPHKVVGQILCAHASPPPLLAVAPRSSGATAPALNHGGVITILGLGIHYPEGITSGPMGPCGSRT